jgi:hypothetical protein
VVKYKKFQFGWFIVIMFTIVIIWMTFAYIHQWGNNPVDIYGYILFMTIFGGVLLTFYGMTVIVTDNHLKIKFGVGIYSKKVDLSAIKSVTIQKYQFYCGYGIRLLPDGILYNVSGKHAIEIKFKSKKTRILIGTNDWENLKDVIEKTISTVPVH